MTVVSRPYALDFAGATLDFPREYSDEVWEDWEQKMIQAFGARWPAAQDVLAAFEDLGIYWEDLSPTNLAFLD